MVRVDLDAPVRRGEREGQEAEDRGDGQPASGRNWGLLGIVLPIIILEILFF